MASKTVAKNTAFMIAASIGQKIISLTYFTIIARKLGPEQTGTYTAALAMTTIFVVFVDLGFTNVFVREAAKAKDKIQELFSIVLYAKIFFGVLSYIALAITLQLLNFDTTFQMLVLVSGITMLFDSIHLTLYGAFRALGNLVYEGIGIVGSQLLTLALGLGFLFSGLPLVYLILAFTIAAACNVLYAAWILKSRFGLHIKPVYNKRMLKHVGVIAIPFALAAIFGRVYSYSDVVILKKLVGATEVGYYSTPSKISFAFQFIPLALIASLYPKFSELFVHNKKKLARLFEQSIVFLLIIALPISVGLFILAHDIIVFVFGEQYMPSIPSLKVLVISLAFSFISFPIGAFLNACSKQKAQTTITGIVLLSNVMLNIVLVPIYGASGAAISALVANILLGLLGYILIPRITHINHAYIFGKLVQMGISVASMALVVVYVNQFLHFFVAIGVGAMVYVVMLFMTKALTYAQLKELIVLVRK